MKEALPMGNMNQIHQYARALLTQKQNREAYEAFKINYDKYPGQFTTIMGMVRGYSAIGDYKTALSYAEKAKSLSPNVANTNSIDKMIGLLKEGKDVN